MLNFNAPSFSNCSLCSDRLFESGWQNDVAHQGLSINPGTSEADNPTGRAPRFSSQLERLRNYFAYIYAGYV